MKKIFLLLAFVAVSFVANADGWTKNCATGVVVLATKHLTPEAKSVVEKYLGTTYEDDAHHLYYIEWKKIAKHTKEIHYLHLDKDFQPMQVEGDDAFAAIEKAVAIVRERNSHSAAEVKYALRTIVNLMGDIHTLSNIRIENIPASQEDYTFYRIKNEVKSKDEKVPLKWSKLWRSHSNRHEIFHADLWAEDLELCHGGNAAEFSKGTLRDWVADNGKRAAYYLSVMQPESVITLRYFNELEYVNYEMVARAGYRLAALLNEIVK